MTMKQTVKKGLLLPLLCGAMLACSGNVNESSKGNIFLSLASRSSSRMPSNRISTYPSVSTTGRYFSFHSKATNLVTNTIPPESATTVMTLRNRLLRERVIRHANSIS